MTLAGHDLLANRYHNKGTAFTCDERDRYHLHGLLPPVVETIDTQLARVRVEYDTAHGDLAKHIFLRALQETNSVLFYRFVAENLAETLPVIYTPTVGLACQEWSRTYRRQHGLYVSWPDRHRISQMLDDVLAGGDVDIVVATDGERILGLGDLGVGGMGIPIGKLALYTAAGHLDPERTLPVMLDAGTDNEALLSDPLYLGWRHRRLRDDAYDELIDSFVDALHRRCPDAVLQWEDFAQRNATRVLQRHRDRICSFNDDIQGTAAVATAALITAARTTGIELSELRTVIVGAGSAGIGIAHQIATTLIAAGTSELDAHRQVFLVDRDGLLHNHLPAIQPFQQPFTRRFSDVEAHADPSGRIDLLRTVEVARPHALIGVTGQPGLFTENVVRAMASTTPRPILLPLSNPTPRAEGIPADLIRWTNGRAIVGTGSPFDPVDHAGRRHRITQVNNLYLFPGLGRGAVAARARTVTDAMLNIAAITIADRAADGNTDELLPSIDLVGEVADAVAHAVAFQAVTDGVNQQPPAEIVAALHHTRWTPTYGSVPEHGHTFG